MTPHIIELGIEIVTLLALYFFSKGFDERITVLEEREQTFLVKGTVWTKIPQSIKELTFKQKVVKETKRISKASKLK
jgi:predicted XRE-type DNA-binding protein